MRMLSLCDLSLFPSLCNPRDLLCSHYRMLTNDQVNLASKSCSVPTTRIFEQESCRLISTMIVSDQFCIHSAVRSPKLVCLHLSLLAVLLLPVCLLRYQLLFCRSHQLAQRLLWECLVSQEVLKARRTFLHEPISCIPWRRKY